MLVIAAGSSAVCMLVCALLPDVVEKLFDRVWGAGCLALVACMGCVPALLSRLGFDISFEQALIPWIISSFVSAIVFLKTGTFFVWLKRAKLSRCIALSFLIAALLYMLSMLLSPVMGVVSIMILPVASCVATFIANRYMSGAESGGKGCLSTIERRGDTFLLRMNEYRRFAPLTLIYTISFGVVSYVVLYLATSYDLVLVIAVSIVISSVFAVVGSFMFNVKFDADRIRQYLLPLIAVALLPFPHLSPIMQIVFLSVAVFGFTCFDAIGWGDLADEVRDRALRPFRHLSAASVINFAGIFAGWGIGFLLFYLLGEDGYEAGFNIVSIVLIILLLTNLVMNNLKESDSGGIANTTDFRDTWKERCLSVARTNKLTRQEERIFVLLARGRNYGHIADELYISKHTVKTHIYHIYQKLEIHSQQELIDIVEDGL